MLDFIYLWVYTMTMNKKEHCNNSNYGSGDNQWSHCGVCGGRHHEPDCTTKKKQGKDCLENHTDEEWKKAGY